VVVLYREGWGTTPFTRVERQAITDRFLKDGWDFLLFVMLNDSDDPPKWLPQSEIRLSFQQYGLEELIGAVKFRAQKLGSIVKSETAVDRAKRFEDESRARADRQERLNSQSSNSMREQWESVIALLSAKISETNKHLSDQIAFGSGPYGFVLRTKRVSLGLCADPAFPTEDSRIIVNEWTGALALTTDQCLGFLCSRSESQKPASTSTGSRRTDGAGTWHRQLSTTTRQVLRKWF